ncbi:MAG TPA: hypothetical protein VHR97_11220 [Candidatus Baltobacteraceae bacterium]|nr:hypothetical protein [Candidatus Baltobacteraceae bacterium]
MNELRKARQIDKDERVFPPAVKTRDEFVCRMEVWNGTGWLECGSHGSENNPVQAAHIYRRPHLNPSIRFNPLIGICACKRHHQAYDAYLKTVRVPPNREERAWRLVCVGNKSRINRRIPPDRPVAA